MYFNASVKYDHLRGSPGKDLTPSGQNKEDDDHLFSFIAFLCHACCKGEESAFANLKCNSLRKLYG